jgi:hypothetical protein
LHRFAGKRTKANTIKIILPILGGVIVLTSILLIWVCKFRGMFSILYTDLSYLRTNTKQLLEAGRERNSENHKTLIHGDFTSDELGEEKTTNDFELPFLKFQDILLTTNNFSNTFMIGQGGFGKVYKVLMMEVPTFAFPRLII